MLPDVSQIGVCSSRHASWAPQHDACAPCYKAVRAAAPCARARIESMNNVVCSSVLRQEGGDEEEVETVRDDGDMGWRIPASLAHSAWCVLMEGLIRLGVERVGEPKQPSLTCRAYRCIGMVCAAALSYCISRHITHGCPRVSLASRNTLDYEPRNSRPWKNPYPLGEVSYGDCEMYIVGEGHEG